MSLRPLRRRALLAALFLSALAPAPLIAGPAPVRFRSIAEGTAEAKESGKPMLLFFTAEWCAPCHELKRTVFAAGAFSKRIEADFVPIEVLDRRKEEGKNAPEVEALEEKMGVRHGVSPASLLVPSRRRSPGPRIRSVDPATVAVG